MTTDDLTHKIQGHLTVIPFNYDMAVDWAIELMKQGIESESLFIVASFSKPVDSDDIKHYVSKTLYELSIPEFAKVENAIGHINYYIQKILEKGDLEFYLKELFKLCMVHDYQFGLTPFYNLHFAIADLKEMGHQMYYQGVTLDNVNSIANKEAKDWINKYLN